MSFIGSQLSTLKAGPFEFGFWIVDRNGEDVPPHGHEEAHLMWALTGAYSTKAEGESPSGRDALIFNPPMTFHADRFETTGAFASLLIDRAMGDAYDEVGLPEVPCHVSAEAPRSLMRRLLQQNAAANSLNSEALCYEILGVIGAGIEEAKPPRWLSPVCDLLREETGVTVRDAAQYAGVHPTHLVRTFRKHLRCTPGEYVRSHRLSRAALLLQEGRHSLTETALYAGFSDQSHLTRAFRRAYGITPAAYRAATSRKGG